MGKTLSEIFHDIAEKEEIIRCDHERYGKEIFSHKDKVQMVEQMVGEIDRPRNTRNSPD